MKFIRNYFSLKERNTSIQTELLAGFTTFLTMAYILAINPSILGQGGMNAGSVFMATAISAAITTILFGIFVKLPFAMAPGMGLNAFFTFGVVIGIGYTWETALTSVFISSILYIILSFLKLREIIIRSIPIDLKYAISAGIGLFITFIGLVNGGIIVKNDATLVGLGDLSKVSVLLAMSGVLITGILLIKKVNGSLLIGTFITYVLALVTGEAALPTQWVSAPPSLKDTFFVFDFSSFTDVKIWPVVLSFLLISLFDTIGTLVGISSNAGFLDENGDFPHSKKALVVNGFGSLIGSSLGTSPLTAYIESSSGISAGGKTGLTSIFVGFFFLLSIFLAPVFLAIPTFATAPILILMGLFMLTSIRKINFEDYRLGIPSFIIIVFMPFTYSIAEGIVFGFISYVLLNLFTGNRKSLNWFSYLLCLLLSIIFFI